MRAGSLTLALGGDVMTGRGIDQILPFPSDPSLHERYVASALSYVELAEARSGAISRPVAPASIWGDALSELERRRPDARIINLETSVTLSGQWEDKGINYRMNPRNIGCLTAAKIDCAVLANNHVLDWGKEGLLETLETLRRAGIASVGAGMNRIAAERAAILDRGARGRIVVLAMGSPTSGIPSEWAATQDGAGVHLVEERSTVAIEKLASEVEAVKRAGDVVVASIHWGENWSDEVAEAQKRFAHALIDRAGVDVLHGHSSHHVKAIEIHHGKLILYGCGDLINDYEGIGGYEAYRGDLGLLYFPRLDANTGALLSLEMVPFTMRRLSLERVTALEDLSWLRDRLNREGVGLPTQGVRIEGGTLKLTMARAS